MLGEREREREKKTHAYQDRKRPVPVYHDVTCQPQRDPTSPSPPLLLLPFSQTGNEKSEIKGEEKKEKKKDSELEEIGVHSLPSYAGSSMAKD